MLGYAAGDEMMIWHSYIGNDESDEEFRYFSLVNENLTTQDAYYTSQLLTQQVIPFVSVERVDEDQFIYKIKRNDHSKVFAAWSGTTGEFFIPDNMTEMTSVVPNSDGTYTWEAVIPGQTVELTTVPILVRP